MDSAAATDQDQRWLLGCLAATLDTSSDARCFAEESLRQAMLQEGFGTALTKITVNLEIPFGLRQLAAVLLKQFIRQHWEEGEENFILPVVSDREKVVIRALLLPSLNDSHGKIRTAIGMGIAAIAQYDWPENWPELLPYLLRLINDQSNKDGVLGALRCLALLSDDLDDASVPRLVPDLFPALHTILLSPHLYENSIRAKALSIVHSCLSVLGSMSGVYKKDTLNTVSAILKPLMDRLSNILQTPLQYEDPEDWGIKMEVLKCLLQLVQNFRVPEAQFSVILAPLWQTFLSSFEVYNLSVVQGRLDYHTDRYDSDGGDQNFETFVIQFFELWTTIAGNSRIATAIGGNIKELAYHTIKFQQITEEQIRSWSVDANQYVADEDDVTYSVRVSGSLLLEAIIDSFGEEGIDSIISACQMCFQESLHSKLKGLADWWKLQEASLFAVLSLSEHFIEADGLTKCNIANSIERMLTESMGLGIEGYPFLFARIFSVVAKFSSVISRGICENIICNAAHAISSEVLPPVKVGACKALSQLLPECRMDIIRPQLMSIFSSLIHLLRKASDEILHLVLETLQASVRAGGELSTSVEPVISPVIFEVWAHHISDPLISVESLEVLEAIKNAPGCLQPFVARILPTIKSILENPKLQPEGLVAGSLDLVTMILKDGPAHVTKAVFDACFLSTIQIILDSDDHGEMQNATECLAAFVCNGRQELLLWGGNQGHVMIKLLDAASRLLDPSLESSVSLFVGSFILQLILHLPSQMSPYMRDLITAVVRRMQSCDMVGLSCSLIVIIARLVHLSAPNVDQFIQLLLALPADGYQNSFVYLMSEWVKLQGDIQGAYQIKVSTTALALLLSTGHSEISKIEVQGYLIKTNAAIVTRSKSKVAPDQWTVVPLPVKIVGLLADALSELMERENDGDEDDQDSDDWEEVSASDDVPRDVISSSFVPSSVSFSAEQLSAMAKVLDEDEGNGFDDDLAKVDPLNEIKLGEFLKGVLANLMERDPSFFNYCCQNLTQQQRSAIQKALTR